MSTNKVNIPLILSIVCTVATGYVWINNNGESNGQVKTNANKVPSLEVNQQITNNKLDVVITKLDDHIKSEENLREEDRQDRKDMIETNKDLIKALRKL